MPNLRKMQIAIKFNENHFHLFGITTHELVGQCCLNLHRYLKKLFSPSKCCQICVYCKEVPSNMKFTSMQIYKIAGIARLFIVF